MPPQHKHANKHTWICADRFLPSVHTSCNLISNEYHGFTNLIKPATAQRCPLPLQLRQTGHSSTWCSLATPAILKSGQISETHAHFFRGKQLSTINYPMKYSCAMWRHTEMTQQYSETTRDAPWCSYCLMLAVQLGLCWLGGRVKLEWWTTVSNSGSYILI
jgi:hypothetical protein